MIGARAAAGASRVGIGHLSCRSTLAHLVALATVWWSALLGNPLTTWAQTATYEGFGATTPGGAGKALVHVTNLNDSGPGSFRAAVAQGDRTVVFDVAGTIELASAVYVMGAFVTIDGFSAPEPGITLHRGALVIRGDRGAHDVIVRGIRVRDAPLDGIQVANATYNVVIDHVSVHGSGDGNIDITEHAHDVTVSWSILAAPASDKNMLIKYGAGRITLHHNLFAYSEQRNPIVSTDDAGTPDTDTTADIRNNVVWDWGLGVGIMIFKGARANVVANYASDPGQSHLDQGQGVVICNLDCPGDLTALALAHALGNLSGDALLLDMNADGNVLDPWPAAPVTTQDAYAAAQDVLASAGARPLDLVDQQVLAGIALPVRPAGPNLSVSFLAVDTAGSALAITDRTTNSGTQPAGASTTRMVLSAGATNVTVTTRSVEPLAPGASSVATVTVPFPAGIPPGTHVLTARADADDAVPESNEADNATAQAVSMVFPDLTVSTFSVPVGTLAGASVSVSDTTRNVSTVGSGAGTATRFFLSADSVLDASDVPLESRAVPALASSATSVGTTALTIPPATPTGSYYLLARADADGVLVELNKANNVAAQPIAIGPPDLVVLALTAADTVKPGGKITVTDTVKNIGAPIPATTTQYLLAVDATAPAGSVVLGSRTAPALAPGAQNSASTSLTVPATVAPGTYHLVARANAAAGGGETNTANNTASLALEVGLDLTVTSLAAPTWTSVGASISISDTTKNLGPGPAAASTTAFFLSPTSKLAGNAVWIGGRAVPALASGATSGGTVQVTIPPGIAGSLYLVGFANADGGTAVGSGSNNARSRAIRVGPDLYVSSLSAPSTAAAGASISVVETTRNGATVDAPGSITRLYLSVTSTVDAGAVLLGHRMVPALAAGDSDKHGTPVTIPAGWPAGRYYIVAKSDGDDAIGEYDEDNNIRARVITVGP